MATQTITGESYASVISNWLQSAAISPGVLAGCALLGAPPEQTGNPWRLWLASQSPAGWVTLWRPDWGAARVVKSEEFFRVGDETIYWRHA